MKKFCILFLLFQFIYAGGFTQEKDQHMTSDIVTAPENWGRESFDLPPSFVPDFGFTGLEEVRFAPGWDDSTNAQFWTYTFAWYLDGDINLTKQHLTNLLEDYFNGLTKTVGRNNRIEQEKIIPANAQFTRTDTSVYHHAFEGTVELFDVFFSHHLIKLRIKVKENYCSEIDKHLIVFSLSPKEFHDEVWRIFDDVASPKDCQALQQATRAH